MTIKKAYTEIVEFLQANPDHKVKSILAQVIEMASIQRASAETTSIRNSAGEVVAVRDAYSNRWCAVVGEKAVEFGIKTNTSTGLNPMTKLALNQHNKQQREAKQSGADLLMQVAKGEVAPSDIEGALAEIEAIRVAPVDLGEGFNTKNALIKYFEKHEVELNMNTVEKASD